MSIQWFPGHMAKAKREVSEQLKKVDLVLELVDARIPKASQNPLLRQLLEGKPRVILLTKSDMADPVETKKWVAHFNEEGIEAVAINALAQTGKKDVLAKVKKAAAPLYDKWKRKGMKPRAIRAMVVGIPNVGKSTVINYLIGKKLTKTGDRPGITKAQQWLKVDRTLELLDTPGILWPKFEDPKVGYFLALTGAVKDELLDLEEIAQFGLRLLKEKYPQALTERFSLSNVKEMKEETILEEIGKKRGCLRAGGVVDCEKAAELLLQEIRKQKLGRLTFESYKEEKKDA
ncbi:ribosome biogenesis GTPase YlqF [Aliibacillus thermotolerans]|uniref:Ribosome biogenesis GTPase A n=1 Tax=Aliibacillus thermotolerans TaxID=1834418 RepID=A0ABW0U3V0_9BACI|nr:ribosome biogenesis GTPase YlqF [Aliibacillus thermotolerans]MDA3130633.1 ribosome biogenesis GTPase YlqF [Aliibacillus thermotolerans]